MSLLTLIFSKDRALQLEATLNSFALHAHEAATTPITVLFRTSSPAFRQGYQQLAKDYTDKLTINWVEENMFRDDVLAQLLGPRPSSRRERWLRRLRLHPAPLQHQHLLFLVDDNIFVRPFSLDAIVDALNNTPTSLGFSLRLGRNTTNCYSLRCTQALPSFQPGLLGLRFSWSGQTGDFGYPLEVSSSVYRTWDLAPLLSRLPFNNPNRLEQVLATASPLLAGRLPELLCFEQSVAFCAPVNKVQTVFDNRAGSKQDNSSEALNELFLRGTRVDVDSLANFKPDAAHVELDLPLHTRSLP
ncbi:hypothetical protein [Cyanobium sp. Morenito 9A2]|uniref:hypothetical protein n=1 Tax=Cyanobium sp. Morenito 9A2 TaxID=2823718 RepID=UPI0020CD3224|nr:hypothetical protein [Cyanobium sp. Morenito 9A2]MCP9850233.1 hypothetical protein [Cyanobium sp. Morenito 9A2]